MCLFPSQFFRPATADGEIYHCDIVSPAVYSISRGGGGGGQGVSLIVSLLPHTLSHCGNEPSHLFLSSYLNTNAKEKKMAKIS